MQCYINVNLEESVERKLASKSPSRRIIPEPGNNHWMSFNYSTGITTGVFRVCKCDNNPNDNSKDELKYIV